MGGMRHAPVFASRSALAFAVALALMGLPGCGSTGGGGAASSQVEEAQEASEVISHDSTQQEVHALVAPVKPLATGVADAGADLHWQFHSYVVFRMVKVELPQRDPMRFENWEAADDFEATEASDTGELTQWDPGWYITHEWSRYGRQILRLIPGDVVSVNGEKIKVEGVFDYPKDSYSSEINEVVDSQYIVFQTCEPNSNLNRIVYGSVID